MQLHPACYITNQFVWESVLARHSWELCKEEEERLS